MVYVGLRITIGVGSDFLLYESWKYGNLGRHTFYQGRGLRGIDSQSHSPSGAGLTLQRYKRELAAAQGTSFLVDVSYNSHCHSSSIH